MSRADSPLARMDIWARTPRAPDEATPSPEEPPSSPRLASPRPGAAGRGAWLIAVAAAVGLGLLAAALIVLAAGGAPTPAGADAEITAINS